MTGAVTPRISPLSSLDFGERTLAGASTSEPLRVRWLGTAGFSLSYQGTIVLIDPYLTRASLFACLRGRLSPDHARLAKYLPRADAIVLGHTHFDHALDAPSIAKRTSARVFGSKSAAALCRLEGVPAAQIHDVEAVGRIVEAEVGPFRLRFVPSAHSRLLFGRVPLAGEIEDCDDVPRRAQDYACGAVFSVEIRVAGKIIYHLGSADLIEAAITTRNVDLLLLCVAGWTKTPHFAPRLMRSLSPGAILLSHWDDFTKPLERGPSLLPAMAVPRLVDALGGYHRDTRVGTLPLLGELSL